MIQEFRDKMKRDEYGEHSGILNWMLEGCRRWQDVGHLVLPKDVQGATETYREEEDPVTRFLEERTTNGKDFSAPAGALYAAFKGWDELNGEGGVMSNVEFANELKGKGFTKIKTNKGASYRGLALNSQEF